MADVKPEAPKSAITLVRRKMAADTKVVVNFDLRLEDEFTTLYDVSKTNAAMLPPFNPLVLKRLCTRNNILMQCVHAMETNIDGTGFEIADDASENKPKGIDPRVQAALAQAASTNNAQKPAQDQKGGPQQQGVDPLSFLQHVLPNKPAPQPQASDTQAPDAPKQPPPKGQDQPSQPGQESPQDQAEKDMLTAFFQEPFPNESFVAMRRKLRADIEQTGNGYLEVMRNIAGEVVFLRHLDSSTMRLVKLDNPVKVTKTIERGGKTFTADMWVRPRRFVQRVGVNYVYFKEFGTERKISRNTGAWLDGNASVATLTGAAAPKTPDMATPQPVLSSKRERLRKAAQDTLDGVSSRTQANPMSLPQNAPDAEGSEVIHFICDKDATTPYGIPRWINNLPAILGSRKAEEFNLGFFDAGGLPPAIVFIQGGALADSVKQQLQAYLGGASSNKHRGAIVEAQSSSGSLDSAGQVKVTVERFGDTRQNDSMFQNYDVKCEDHTRGAFRLPSIFLGKSDNYNFATALTAVMVTEAQVFAPERMEFDEMINHTIVRALGAKKYKYRSLPITLKNSDLQMAALPLAAPKIAGSELIAAINQITGLNLQYSEEAEKSSMALNMANAAKAAAQATGSGQFTPKQPADQAGGGGGGGDGETTTKPNLGKPSGPLSSVAMKAELSTNDLVLLASEWANAVGLTDGPRMEPELRRAIVQKVETLSGDQRKLFNSILASSTFTGTAFDHEGLAELAGCCVGMMGGNA